MNQRQTPLCLSCNYPLGGLESRQCPECGRAFDPADDWTVNMGRPLGPWGRALIRPVGVPALLLAMGAVVMLALETRWPGFWPGYWWGDGREATRAILTKSAVENLRILNGHDRLFVAGVTVWWVAVGWFILRELLRVAVLLTARPGKRLRVSGLRRRSLTMLLLGAGFLLISFGWPYRIGQREVDAYLAQTKIKRGGGGLFGGVATPTTKPFSLVPPQATADSAKSLQVARAEVSSLPTSGQRMVGLMNLIHEHGKEALPILLERAPREEDVEIRNAMIHLIGVYRDTAAVEDLLKMLESADASTRAAVIDAIGIIYAPSYRIPNGEGRDWSGGELRTSPSIELRNVIDYRAEKYVADAKPQALSNTPMPMPGDLQKRLAEIMLNGTAVEEREAAARAMIQQPPAGYTLRYAEWGVWLASDNDVNLHMAQAIEDIPPFVHRIGNPVASLGDHVLQKPIIVNKPVIHLTASAPMAADLEVRIRLGRPWFAYPKPDDFSVGVEGHMVGRGLALGGELNPPQPLAPLDKPDLALLPDAREGYPWLLPAHRQHDAAGAPDYNSMNYIAALGVRWQSLIVSPMKLAWMSPPAVPAGKHFGWWSRLRDVDCSWVSSRGESDRFLYYDGPTVAPNMSEVYLERGKLRFSPNVPMPFSGILVEVKEGHATGTIVNVMPQTLTTDLASLQGSMKVDPQEQLKSLLLKHGLHEGEADGLLDCWTNAFFKAPGLRFIMVIGTATYDAQCPMEIRPAATERVRVGLQLKELRGG